MNRGLTATLLLLALAGCGPSADDPKKQIGAHPRRGELLQKRRALMEAWANYCNGAADTNVVQFDVRAA